MKNIMIFILVTVLLASLYFLAQAIQSAEQFNRIYLWLFGASIIAVLVLVVIIMQRLVWLYLRRKENEAGIQLTTRMVTIFIALSLPPVLIVYLFATQFLNNYIDSWFDSKTNEALNDSLSLGQIYLDTKTLQALSDTKDIANKLAEIDEPRQAIYLERFLDESQANSLTLLSASGKFLGNASIELFELNTDLPPQSAYREVRAGNYFARIEPKTGIQLQVRTLVKVENVLKVNSSNRYIQGLFPIENEYSELAANIETATVQYNQQSYQREQLKTTFIIILTLVLLMSMLLALLRAFSSARNLVAPVRLLSKATEAIAEGDFSQTIPVSSKDEIGFLVKSFNKMSSQLASSSALAHRAQTDAESQKWYLESVLSHLSSGVISVDNDQRILMANSAASKILKLSSKSILNQNIEYIGLQNEGLIPFVELIITKLNDHTEEWHQEMLISENEQRKILVVRGSRIPENEQEAGGMVVVFDDETIINQAQRDAAWSEVARRLAHEVKNPLTPIQLSAERLRLRFLKKLPEEDKDILDRATQTIVSQVENLKTLVNAFSDYAKAPELKREPGGLNQLIKEVVDLYLMSHTGIHFKLNLLTPEPTIFIDKGRFTQLFTNIIKNSQESADNKEVEIKIESKINPANDHHLQIILKDNGHGFNDKILTNVFEPYETTKSTGSGLGLAIVKKIVEEHGGNIKAYNQAAGAAIEINLPIYQKS
jgi:nitrogen fixation/metabolism regulation signal transduction histidine kinase